MAKTIELGGASLNIIAAGTIISGELKASGDFRIDGTVKGLLEIQGKLVLGASGKIEGNIICQNADISGQIEAKITVKELLHLKATAQLNGEIFTNKLAIDPGAVFTGICCMDNAKAQPLYSGKKQQAEISSQERSA